MATTYEVPLPGERVVLLREMTAGEFELMWRAEGDKPGASWEVTQRGLRMTIAAIDGEEVTYADLVGDNLNQRFSVKELLLLRQAWESLHMPSQEDIARVRGMRAIALARTST